MKLYSGTETSAPIRIGQRYFFTRAGDQNHAIVYYRDGGPENEPQIAINPNEFSADGATALDWWYPSPNGRLIAYGRSDSGSELSTLYLRLLETNTDSADHPAHTGQFHRVGRRQSGVLLHSLSGGRQCAGRR